MKLIERSETQANPSSSGTRSGAPGRQHVNQETKPRPRPRTVEEWREARRQRYRQAGDKGGFRVLPTKVIDSDAFNELSKSGKRVLIVLMVTGPYSRFGGSLLSWLVPRNFPFPKFIYLSSSN